MIKKLIFCLLGCITNYALLIIEGAILIQFSFFSQFDFLNSDFVITFETILVIVCIIIGVFYLNLDLDKMFLKQETTGFRLWERIIITCVAAIIVIVLVFELFYNFTHVTLRLTTEFNNTFRFVTIPMAIIVNSILGTACLFATEYFHFIKN